MRLEKHRIVTELVVLVIFVLAACASPNTAAEVKPRTATECVAKLTGLPLPDGLPVVRYLPTERFQQYAKSLGHSQNVYGVFLGIGRKGLITLREKREDVAYPIHRFPIEPLPHELTHYLQWEDDGHQEVWRMEAQARWVERKFDAWCR